MESKVKRYFTIDFFRGFAIFANVFVHIFTDIYDTGAIQSNLFNLPLSLILLFVCIGYFGSFGSLFIMISGTGNMVSIQKGFEKGKTVKSVVTKQIVGGIILLIFSFLVEGLFQFYGYFGTIFGWNGHEHDPTRIIWHAFTMTPVHCIAVGMIITGIVHGLISRNNGHEKYKRNTIIYLVLAIAVVACSQLVWNACKAIVGPGFPNEYISGDYPGDYKIFMPPPGATFFQYIGHFFLAIFAGSNHPIFPFLAMTFIGNIIGIVLISQSKKEKPDPKVPRKGIYAGWLIILIGVAFIFILGVDFDSILPVNAIGDITKIHDGLGGFWIPWWTFLLAGELMMVFMILRLVEYRGLSKSIANKTKFIRRYGMPAFSVYSWHRFWAIPVIVIISALLGQPSWVSGSITGVSFNWFWVIVTIVLVWVVCTLILIGWEKIGYIGGIEWMMGTLAGVIGIQKSKSTVKERVRWWEHGMIDSKKLFYNPEWIDVIPRNEGYHQNKSESKFAMKLSFLGLFIGLFSILSLQAALKSKKSEGGNRWNKKATNISIIGICIMVLLVILTSTLTLGMLGISL